MATTQNWLPKAWTEAAGGQSLIVNGRIENAFKAASDTYEVWRVSRNVVDRWVAVHPGRVAR